MKLISSAFAHLHFIPEKYTCDGENISPPLVISAIMPGVKTLALIVDDPDAPGGDWVHWLVWNIDRGVSEIPENSVPIGAIQGLNSFGDYHYGGPCPPSGTHRYQFKLSALSIVITDELSPLSNKADLERVIKTHVLDQTILTGLYSKT